MRARAAIAVMVAALTGAILPANAADCTRTSVGLTPLTEMGSATYQGFEGGLYPSGDTPPAAYRQTGLTMASLAVPRNAAGIPDANGRSIVLTIGMSNTRSESAALVALAATDALKHPRVTVVNGAQGGQDADTISDPAAPYWTYVDQQIANAGATAAQVQAVWLKEAIARPTEAFPDDARRLQDDLRSITQILKARFPNLFVISLSSRIYAGYATTALNPEPYAYQSGYAIKWLIEEAIGSPLPVPWLTWGPYLWADGTTARADGLTWSCSDFNSDGTHPNATGASKVAGMILDSLHTDPVLSLIYVHAGAL